MRLTLLLALLALTTSVNAETITLTPSDDASIRQGINAVNESAKWLDVFDLTNSPRQAFIKFNIDDYSDDTIGDDIESATLRVYIQSVLRAGEVTFGILAEDWDEDSLTGNDYPTSFSNSSYATADIAKNDRGDYLEIDITDVAKDWFDGNGNYGIAIQPTSGDGARIRFGSQRVSSKRPEVVMEIADTGSIPYEHFKLIDSDNDEVTDTLKYAAFYAPTKGTYSKVTMLFQVGVPYWGYLCTSYIGVALYSAETSWPFGPDELIDQGETSFSSTQEENEENYEVIDIEFDNPVSLRPDKRYWLVAAADESLSTCTMYTRATPSSMNAFITQESVSGVYSYGNGFLQNPANGESAPNESPRHYWFRLIP